VREHGLDEQIQIVVDDGMGGTHERLIIIGSDEILHCLNQFWVLLMLHEHQADQHACRACERALPQYFAQLLPEGLRAAREHVQAGRAQQPPLVHESPVDRARRHAGRAGDAWNRRAVQPVLGQHLEGGLQQACVRAAAAFLLRRAIREYRGHTANDRQICRFM
jgi:hypothetical protein